MTRLLDPARVEIKLGGYGVAPATALEDITLHPRVQDYRRNMAAQMQPLDHDDIRKRLPPGQFHISRKIDGEFTVLAMRGDEVLSVNPGGTVRVGLPWQQEAAELLRKAGVNEALVCGELHVARREGRARVHDVSRVARQPQSTEDLESLHFAPFDLMPLDPMASPPPFSETWEKITSYFGSGTRVRPPQAVWGEGVDDVLKQYDDWVLGEGAEGLVVRSDVAGSYKIKPRYTLDVAVVGFTESIDDRQGMLHDVLVAVMRSDRTLHVLGRVGGGFTEDERRAMLSDLKDQIVDSEYAEVNSDHVAYQMVRPNWVIEVSCLDVVSQTTRGAPINRMVLDWDTAAERYKVIRRLPLASVISPQFVRRREDKQVNPQDIRIDQLATIVEIPHVDRDARQMTLPNSEVMRREVYTKVLKGETMVRKFLIWKTNKESSGDDFPGYVLYYTDYSPNRKSPLDREIRVSNSEEQIKQLWDEFVEKNIKQGWKRVAMGEGEAPAEPAAEAKPAKKAAKKAAAKTADEDSTAEPSAEEASPEAATDDKPTKKKKAAKKKAAKTEDNSADDSAADTAAEASDAKPAKKAAKKKTAQKKAPKKASKKASK